MYDLSRVTVAEEKLEKFASVELVPDKTMRIILTGDLLFPSGTAALTDKAKQSLKKLIPIIRQSPYMINVIGHTDNIPMHSQKFASNWELSTARASRVARFLIEEANIPASHFVVAGYSYFRPIKPNTTAANRGANRRVEIIISKEPPPARQSQSTATP
jgi:chemotaxis protein MotB